MVDYKSGRPPSNKEVAAGWSPQLTLEAAMLSSGAFRGVETREVSEAFYLPVGGGKDKPRRLGKDRRAVRRPGRRAFRRTRPIAE